MLMNEIAWVALAYFSGSIPFSYILGKLVSAIDIRSVGDRNPGAVNVWKAGGAKVGVAALVLDYSKGMLPVIMAVQSGVSNYTLVAVALAPIVGHAFTPFLGFRGGKAIAVTMGVWTGLTLWEAPVFIGFLFMLFYLFQENDGWSVIFAMIALLSLLLLRWHHPELLLIWGGNTAILFIKHLDDLACPPSFKRVGFVRKQ
jgi:acyl phosphate:glycerol-3-phosphate acyltransferase